MRKVGIDAEAAECVGGARRSCNRGGIVDVDVHSMSKLSGAVEASNWISENIHAKTCRKVLPCETNKEVHPRNLKTGLDAQKC
jgi:hypothetical protein